MIHAPDPRIADAKARPILEVAEALDIHWMTRGFPERTGPCPVCGGHEKRGADRFSLNLRDDVFYCRRCDIGGDQIKLVQFARGIEFKAALDWLCGDRPALSAEEEAARATARAAAEKARRTEADRYHAQSVTRARRIWAQGLDAGDVVMRGYFARRGLPEHLLEPPPRCLRFHPALPYMIAGDAPGTWREIHRGPAMLAAVQKSDGKAEAVHRTWIDLARPNGKAAITHPETGEALPAKKVEGSKKGGAIRLTGHLRSDILVMGEGIETTLSAQAGWDGPVAMFWAGVDLGNMAGQRMLGQGLKYAGIPDMTDRDAFLPPAFVRRLVFVMDGDSEPRLTEAKLKAGLRRAMATIPGLRGQIARAPVGRDLNDVLMEVGG